jgi:uncharacterized C2H2 Zn-finger protein
MYKCCICNRNYGSSMTLRRHEQNSHGVNAHPATCDECGKVFKHIHSLKTHLYVIHGHRRTSSMQYMNIYKCKNCFMSFRLKQELVNHINSEHLLSFLQYDANS